MKLLTAFLIGFCLLIFLYSKNIYANIEDFHHLPSNALAQAPNDADNTATKPIQAPTSSDLLQCKFYRNDQTPGSSNCPPSEQGFRCEQALTFKSPLLLQYVQKASEITGVPSEVLAGLIRIESTVSQANSVTGKAYSISDYTDEDIKAMGNTTSVEANIDATIGDTNKALCPRSPTGALGITQIQPKGTTGNSESSVNRGAAFLAKFTGVSKNNDTLGIPDYCDPQKSLILAGGFILAKMGKQSWPVFSNDQDYETFVNQVARSYYGDDGQTGAYANSLWRSVSECRAAKTSGALSPGTASNQTIKSNLFVTKVGNPTGPPPQEYAQYVAGGAALSGGTLGVSLTCPLDPVKNTNFDTSCGTSKNPVNGCGHGLPPGYGSCKAPPYAECGEIDSNGYRHHSAFLEKSADIIVPGGSIGKPVYLPFANGNISLNWHREGEPIPISDDQGHVGGWGYRVNYTSNFQGKQLFLDLTHIDQKLANSGADLPSGTQVGTIFNMGGAHLHTGLKVDGVPVEVQKEAFMCSHDTPASQVQGVE